MINIHPFKADLSWYSDINAIFLILLASLAVCVTGININSFEMDDMITILSNLAMVFGVLPLLYIIYLLFYCIGHSNTGNLGLN